jgi:hypothetical protein
VNGKKRVLKAIEFDRPDRVPYAGFRLDTDLIPMILLTPKTWQPTALYFPYVSPLELSLGTWRSKRRLPRHWIHTKHQAIDEWGIVWERFGTFTSQGQVIDPPIKTWENLESLHVPDPRDPHRYRLFTRLGKLFPRKFKTGDLSHFLFERYHFLRGWENSMRDLVRPSPQVESLLNMLCDYFMAVADEWIQRGVDGILLVDDLGGQREPLMSPKAFQSLFFPRYKKIIEYCHDHGKPVFLHSCGDVREVMPALVEAGIDVFQFDSPDMTGIEWCAENFGGKVAFMDVVDIQNVIPDGKGTPEGIIAYTKRLIHQLGRFDGGLILSEYPTPKDLHPQPRAFGIMHGAWKRFGRYPLNVE